MPCDPTTTGLLGDCCDNFPPCTSTTAMVWNDLHCWQEFPSTGNSTIYRRRVHIWRQKSNNAEVFKYDLTLNLPGGYTSIITGAQGFCNGMFSQIVSTTRAPDLSSVTFLYDVYCGSGTNPWQVEMTYSVPITLAEIVPTLSFLRAQWDWNTITPGSANFDLYFASNGSVTSEGATFPMTINCQNPINRTTGSVMPHSGFELFQSTTVSIHRLPLVQDSGPIGRGNANVRMVSLGGKIWSTKIAVGESWCSHRFENSTSAFACNPWQCFQQTGSGILIRDPIQTTTANYEVIECGLNCCA